MKQSWRHHTRISSVSVCVCVHSPGQVEHSCEFACELFALFEALRVEDDLSNELVVRGRHGNRAEKLLQVVRELLSPSVTFTGGVQSDEHTGVSVQLHLHTHTIPSIALHKILVIVQSAASLDVIYYLFAQEVTGVSVLPQRVLNGLDLHGHSRQHGFLQTIKLVEAAPSATLYQPHEDTTHRLHVDALHTHTHKFKTVGFCLKFLVKPYLNNSYWLLMKHGLIFYNSSTEMSAEKVYINAHVR